MKERIKEGLEKVVKVGRAIKKNWKKTLITLSLPFVMNDNTYASTGRLDVLSMIEYNDYSNGRTKILHRLSDENALEGYDNYDSIYLPKFNPSGVKAKIVSILEEETEKKELEIDSRPEYSTSTIDLELSLHSQSGSPITISSTNVLDLSFTPFGDFDSEPITYWERDANDPNMFYLIANVRKEMLQNGGIIPLPDLNGTYGSEVPYLYAQIRFNDHFVHLNDDDIVDFKDYSIFATNLGRTGITNTNRADPTDLGAWADYDLDGDVDMADLGIFSDYYLTSKKYHLEDGWIIDK